MDFNVFSSVGSLTLSEQNGRKAKTIPKHQMNELNKFIDHQPEVKHSKIQQY